MNVVEMPPEEFARVVDGLMEGKIKDDPFQSWEGLSLVDVRGFEAFCASCLDDKHRLHGRAIA